MKILTIPDTHGFDFWKQYVYKNINEFDKIIFLGDYVDEFKLKDDVIIQNLMDIIELKFNNPNKIELLWGNHDIQYLYLNTEVFKQTKCHGYRRSYAWKLNKIFIENKYLFKPIHIYKNYIWSHAGFSTLYMKQLDYYIKAMNYIDSFEEKITELFNTCVPIMYRIGWAREGYYNCGSFLWADIKETYNHPLEGHHQVVGHSPIKEPFKIGNEDTSVLYLDREEKIIDEKNIIVLT